ncbi:MAG: cobalamin-dependent protein [Gammaproteobacteria bacterium]
MSSKDPFTAELLEVSAAGYASLAARRLLEQHPEVAERFGPDALSAWKSALAQRVVELAAALKLGAPRVFAGRVLWTESAFRAREIPVEDLQASLEALAAVLQEELPEASRKPVGQTLALALEALEGSGPRSEMVLDPGTPTGQLALKYITAVLEGDSRAGIDLVLGQLDHGLSVESAYVDVLMPAQRELGRLWHAGELGIAEEHLVTHTTQRLMSLLAHRAPRAEANGYTAVCASVLGNAHDIGIRVIADFLEIAGWRSIYLGADVPASELSAAVQYFEGDLLVLSAALPTQLEHVGAATASVRRLENRDVKVMVGGLAFGDQPELWKTLGADGYAESASEAVDLAASLVAGRKPG